MCFELKRYTSYDTIILKTKEQAMPLQEIDINRDRAARKKIKAIYEASFPKEEKLPFPLLRLLTFIRGIDFTAYKEGENILGFTYTVMAGEILFVLFFAVDESLRGKGAGSAILSHLKEKGKAVLLNIEPLDPAAGNYEERLLRFRFYEKNGFFDTGYDIKEVGGTFRVLSTEKVLDVTAYKKVFRKMSLGFWDVSIYKGSTFSF